MLTFLATDVLPKAVVSAKPLRRARPHEVEIEQRNFDILTRQPTTPHDNFNTHSKWVSTSTAIMFETGTAVRVLPRRVGAAMRRRAAVLRTQHEPGERGH